MAVGKEKTCANRQHASIDYQTDFFIEYLLALAPQEALRKAGVLWAQTARLTRLTPTVCRTDLPWILRGIPYPGTDR
jgi:hypothetical protein